jgi:hypothetical protein
LRVSRTVVVLLLISGAYVVGRESKLAKSTAAASTSTSIPLRSTGAGFYLAIGGSSSLGIQPDGIPSDDAERTKTGYANDVVKLERSQRHLELGLTQIGCLATRIKYLTVDPASNSCYKLPTTQLTTAVDFLRSHHGVAGIVSVDLGFNDIRYCLWEIPINAQCVPDGLAGVVEGLPTVLKDLKDAAGPRVAIVGLTYYDPFLAFYLDGSTGPARATQSLDYITQLNALLVRDYTLAAIPIANEPAVFNSHDHTPISLANVGTVPANVFAICADTWMCVGSPFGPDDHPNNVGYMLIARSIVAALPKPWNIAVVK